MSIFNIMVVIRSEITESLCYHHPILQAVELGLERKQTEFTIEYH